MNTKMSVMICCASLISISAHAMRPLAGQLIRTKQKTFNYSPRRNFFWGKNKVQQKEKLEIELLSQEIRNIQNEIDSFGKAHRKEFLKLAIKERKTYLNGLKSSLRDNTKNNRIKISPSVDVYCGGYVGWERSSNTYRVKVDNKKNDFYLFNAHITEDSHNNSELKAELTTIKADLTELKKHIMNKQEE